MGKWKIRFRILGYSKYSGIGNLVGLEYKISEFLETRNR